MKPTEDDLRRHYSSLSNEALLSLDRSELSALAQQCYDEEIAQRDIDPEVTDQASSNIDGEVEPDWLPDAACACSFDSFPGNDGSADLEQARNVLESADIPCYVKFTQVDEAGGGPQSHYLYELQIPGSMILLATSILDKEFFNPRLENEWKAHFEELSDEDFRELSLEDLTAGMTDRLERLKRTYLDEQSRREP